MAYSLDSATFLWGIWCESMLHEVDEKGKPRYRLERLLEDAPPRARPLVSLYEAVKGRAKTKQEG